jgi:hypothetical protein
VVGPLPRRRAAQSPKRTSRTEDAGALRCGAQLPDGDKEPVVTGPEHYVAAEGLLARAGSPEASGDQERLAVAAAHVHATLALAAATALNESGMPFDDHQAWREAAATR